jgi:hypothetical protein
MTGASAAARAIGAARRGGASVRSLQELHRPAPGARAVAPSRDGEVASGEVEAAPDLSGAGG